MVSKGLGLLGEGFKNLLDGIAGFFGGAIHASGSAARGRGGKMANKAEGKEQGRYHAGTAQGYAAELEGVKERGKEGAKLRLGYEALHNIEEDLHETRGEVKIKRSDLEHILTLEPAMQAQILKTQLRKSGGMVYLPKDVVEEAVFDEHRYVKKHGNKTGYHSPLENEVTKYVAIILFGLALVFLLPMSITGFSILGGGSGSINYIELLGAALLFFAVVLSIHRRE